MTRQHVQNMVAKRAATPGAANDLLKKIKILVRFAIDNGRKWRGTRKPLNRNFSPRPLSGGSGNKTGTKIPKPDPKFGIKLIKSLIKSMLYKVAGIFLRGAISCLSLRYSTHLFQVGQKVGHAGPPGPCP